MDVFGHTAVSLLLGRAVAPRVELRTATTVAALCGGLLPDVDAITYLWGADAFRRFHHLYTHNIVAFVVLPIAIGLLLNRAFGQRGALLVVAAGIGMASHLVGDVIGLWPLTLLVPFVDAKFGLGLLDQDFSLALDLVLVVGAVVSFWDPVAESPRRLRGLCAVTCAAAAVAVALT